MSLYAVIKGPIVDGIAIADSPLETDGMWVCIDGMNPQPGPGWGYENGVFTPPPPPPPLPNIITKPAFRFRFTDQEYVGILTAAKTNIEVASWVETFNMTTTIDLDNQRTIAGVQNLVTANLLTQERATEILTDPVQPGERP